MSHMVEFQVKIKDKLCVVQYLMMYILNSFYTKIKAGRRQILFFISYDILGRLKIRSRMSKIVKSSLDSRTEGWTSKMLSFTGPE